MAVPDSGERVGLISSVAYNIYLAAHNLDPAGKQGLSPHAKGQCITAFVIAVVSQHDALVVSTTWGEDDTPHIFLVNLAGSARSSFWAFREV